MNIDDISHKFSHHSEQYIHACIKSKAMLTSLELTTARNKA